MKLSAETTIIAPEKLRDYVLNPLNLDGAAKARFLAEIGYRQNEWQILEADLRAQHLSQEVMLGRVHHMAENTRFLASCGGPTAKRGGFDLFG